MAVDQKFGTFDVPGVPDDEPVFVIRAQDAAAVDAIRSYGECAGDIGASQEFLESVEKASVEFEEWQTGRGSKVPD